MLERPANLQAHKDNGENASISQLFDEDHVSNGRCGVEGNLGIVNSKVPFAWAHALLAGPLG